MKEKLINFVKELEANYGLQNFVEAYKEPKNPYFRAIKILKLRYGVTII